MTLLSEIIRDAYRESNLIPLISNPTAAQVTEGLSRLNKLIVSSVGNEAGSELNELTIGGDYPEDTSLDRWVPDEVRLMLNLTEAKSYDLDPYPKEGQRFGIVDVAGNLATYNVTLNGNGRRIEDATSLVLNTNDLVRQWMYRSDAGWVRIETLTDSDDMPFPVEFDDYFVIMLAMRLNPRYGQTMPPESMEALRRSRSQFRARYNRPRQLRPDLDVRNYLTDKESWGGYSDFDRGDPYLWR